ncbi:MAG TPA: hypothetical protein VN026_00690 [Bacteroidia bacterium]|jgi:hypothetical protein|nr:hypothetical protein [Bacteroidia bacterium]
MKNLILIFSLFAFSVYGQKETLYALPTPKNWGTEKILFPIKFAPQIDYKGIEEIRFMPGWARMDSSEYWSYDFLWYLDGRIIFEPVMLESKMKVYYEGLAAATKSVPREKLIPVIAKFQYDVTAKDDIKTFIGTIEMLDYMMQEKLLLNCKIHWRNCGKNKTVVFFELSPKPVTHKVWEGLDKVWTDFNCKK